MSKTFVGSRLRQLRAERGLSQVNLAETLGLSPSYVNQIEHDQRPLTASVLGRITEAFGVDATFFSYDDSSRLFAEVQDVVLDRELCPTPINFDELYTLVVNHPDVARTMVDMHRRYRYVRDKLTAATDARIAPPTIASTGEDSEQQQALGNVVTPHPLSMPHDEVRDFFYATQNYLDEIDRHAEALAAEMNLGMFNVRATESAITERLRTRHNVQVEAGGELGGTLHTFDQDSGVIHLSSRLIAGQRAFRLAAELSYLEALPLLNAAVDQWQFSTTQARNLALRGVASYFAAATMLPYTMFHQQAERCGYDIEYLCQMFGLGYETICHRLSTMQRPNLRGIPFTFVRVDRAGNISKRQSATGFHFTHAGGTCPLWNIYDTFTNPGTIMRQFAQMPDGRTYLWVARTVKHHQGRFGETGKLFAIGLGCEARHAERTVYAKGFDLTDLTTATPIGVGCRVCTRENCAQRAFPAVNRSISVDPHSSNVAPY